MKSLRHVHLLGPAPASLIAELEEAATWMDFPPNHVVLERNDPTTDVFFITRGRVKVLDFVGGGQEIVLAELGQGETFGELSALDSQKRSARIATIEPTTLAAITADDFRILLLRCPEVALTLLGRFAGIIRSLVQRVTVFSSLTPHQRVYIELLRISEPNPQGDGSWIIHTLPNHGEIAARIGTDREVVALSIGELARERVVERRHKSLVIRDYSRLQMLSGV